jgi:peptidoglycan endopeptidase LytE
MKKRLEGVEGVESHSLVYTVKSGDSLEKIARAHKTTVEKIKKYNQFDQDLIVVGQILKIPQDPSQ